MAEDRASIDGSTILDNADDRQVEFSAEVGGDWYEFALHYAVLEALSGTQIDDADNVTALFEQFRDEVEEAVAKALAREPGTDDIVTIDESDIQ